MACDLNSHGAVEKLITSEKPDCILNCAAVANIDVCEKEPLLAEEMNSLLPKRLAAVAGTLGIKIIHISTDAVFDGIRGGYSETDAPSPVNVYGRTKLAGENGVLTINPKAIVARVNFFGWSLSGKRSLAEWFYNNLKNNNKISGFTDIYFCPVLVNILCDTLARLAESGTSGVYHVVGGEAISKYDFGIKLAEKFGFDRGLISKAAFSKNQDVAPRGGQMTLSTLKLYENAGMTMPGVDESLEGFHALCAEHYPERLRSMLAV